MDESSGGTEAPGAGRADTAEPTVAERLLLEAAAGMRRSDMESLYGEQASAIVLSDPRFLVMDGWVVSREFAGFRSVPDHYAALGLARGATKDEVESAYASLGEPGSDEARDARRVLADDVERGKYDRVLEAIRRVVLEQARLPSFRFLSLGGGDEVGRSCYYVRVGTHRFLLDAGAKPTDLSPLYPHLELLAELPPVEAIFVSHGHFDHTGALSLAPRGVPIIMTPGTKKTVASSLQDLVNKRQLDPTEAKRLVDRFVTLTSGEVNGARYALLNAGHISGSAMVRIESEGDSLLYTGDVNFERTRFQVPAEATATKVDTVIAEATYAGQPDRERREDREKKFVSLIGDLAARGRKVLVPTFAIGRTEEVCALLDDAIEKKKIQGARVYLIGLGAAISTELGHANWRNITIIGGGGGRFDMVAAVNQLKETFRKNRGTLVVAGSGFLNEGVASQILPDALGMDDADVVLTGYQPKSSTGSLLLRAKAGEETAILGKRVTVRCGMHSVGLSAHGSSQMILDFVRDQSPRQLIVVHSERGRDFARAAKRFAKFVVPAVNGRIVLTHNLGLTLRGAGNDRDFPRYECECGKTFFTPWSASRHSATENHRLLSRKRICVFSVRNPDGRVRDRLVALSSRLGINIVGIARSSKDHVSVEGELSEEQATKLAQGLAQSLGTEVTFVGEEKVFAGSPVRDLPIAANMAAGDVSQLLGSRVTVPMIRKGDLPRGMAGYYDPRRALIVMPVGRLHDEEDFDLALTHELAHHAQFTLNGALAGGRARLSREQREEYMRFTEGFAQYVVLRTGRSKKLLQIYHELGAPDHYSVGSRMFQEIEMGLGRRRAMCVALNGTPMEFVRTHALAVEAIAGSEYFRRVLKVLEENGIWRRYLLLKKGFPRSIREEMSDAVSRSRRDLGLEYAGWPTELVSEEMALYAMADLLVSKAAKKPLDRDEVKDALKVIFVNMGRYRSLFDAAVRSVLQGTGLPEGEGSRN